METEYLSTLQTPCKMSDVLKWIENDEYSQSLVKNAECSQLLKERMKEKKIAECLVHQCKIYISYRFDLLYIS